jgi:hypothetical protein
VCLRLCDLLYLQPEQARRHDLAEAQVASSNLTRAMAQQAEASKRRSADAFGSLSCA